MRQRAVLRRAGPAHARRRTARWLKPRLEAPDAPLRLTARPGVVTPADATGPAPVRLYEVKWAYEGAALPHLIYVSGVCVGGLARHAAVEMCDWALLVRGRRWDVLAVRRVLRFELSLSWRM